MKINDIITKKELLNFIKNDLLMGQRLNIKNNEGELFITKGIFLNYNYKAPSKCNYNFNEEDVKKYVLNGKNKYKVISLPSGINSFAYELEKM